MRKAFKDHPEVEVQSMAERLEILEHILTGIEYRKKHNYNSSAYALDEVRRMAQARKDTVMQYLCLRQFHRLYESLEDTVNQLKVGYESYKLALQYGDSTYAMMGLLDLVRVESDSSKMRSVVRASDNYFEKNIRDEAFYSWCRGWVLSGHGCNREALPNLLRADTLMRVEDPDYWPVVLWTLGGNYYQLGEYHKAINALNKGIEFSIKDAKWDWASGMATYKGESQLALGDYRQAETSFRKAIEYARMRNSLLKEESAMKYLKNLLLNEGRYEEYAEINELWIALYDTLDQIDAGDNLLRLDLKLQQFRDSVTFASDKAALGQKLRQEETRRNIFLLSGLGFLVFGVIVFLQRRRTQKALKESDELLLNILPAEIAEELKEKGEAAARDFDRVSILFTDFKGFTEASEKLSAIDLVAEINRCFRAFDGIVGKYKIEKIKTIGDAYMAAGGLPVPNEDSVKNTVLAGLAMQAFIVERKAERDAQGLPAFEMRVGIHTGPVVAGIVGVKKFQYDIWGDAVNTASRMESSGEVRQVNISRATYELVKDNKEFRFTSRGIVKAKGKGEMEMWFVRLS
jgi:class 3 adenylate cyclase/predicted negative regulator of RcsB-dependent stress response